MFPNPFLRQWWGLQCTTDGYCYELIWFWHLFVCCFCTYPASCNGLYLQCASWRSGSPCLWRCQRRGWLTFTGIPQTQCKLMIFLSLMHHKLAMFIRSFRDVFMQEKIQKLWCFLYQTQRVIRNPIDITDHTL